jgi:hypothetical protein
MIPNLKKLKMLKPYRISLNKQCIAGRISTCAIGFSCSYCITTKTEANAMLPA